MRKPPVFAVEKQNPRQCLCLWRKHKSDGKKQENVLKNKNINVRIWQNHSINSVFFWKYVA